MNQTFGFAIYDARFIRRREDAMAGQASDRAELSRVGIPKRHKQAGGNSPKKGTKNASEKGQNPAYSRIFPRLAGKFFCKWRMFWTRFTLSRHVGLETRDTADLEICATRAGGQPFGIVRFRSLPPEFARVTALNHSLDGAGGWPIIPPYNKS